MKLQKGKEYFGFELKEKKKIVEDDIESYFFIHLKTGAEVLFLKNNDRDKMFGVAFKTPSFNSTGINHILEHSVLQGSAKYPMKDVFTVLLKEVSSTSINAMTYPDKTVYPVSSLYESEFQKLRNVYCDAVFNPNVLRDEEIFQQEKMVVFNEMKGAMSDIDRMVEQEILANLFPDNFYKYNSGGDPREILNLTHQQLVEHHQKFYHPSNSYTFIYGKTDILKHLEFLDNEYFSKSKKRKINSGVKLQKKWSKPKNKIKKYFSIDKNKQKKDIFNISFLMPSQKNKRDILGLSILFSLLLSHSTSPLKKVLLEKDLAEKIEYDFWTQETIQTVFSLTLKNAYKENQQKFKKIFFETLEKISKNGFDQKLIQGKLNKIEFALHDRKNKTQKGLSYFENISLTWLNGFGYEIALEEIKNFKEIKKLSRQRYFEKLIQKYLLKNNNHVFLTLIPNSKNPYEKLKLTVTDPVRNTVRNTKKQEIKLKPLAVSKLPRKTVLGKLVIKKTKNNIEHLFYKSKNENISHLKFYFDARVVAIEKIQYVQLLSQLLDDQISEEFKKEIDLQIGSIRYLTQIFTNKKKEILPKFVLSVSFLNRNLDKVNKILEKIFTSIDFDEKKVREKVQNIKNSLENAIVSDGYNFALLLAAANLNQKGLIEEKINGYSYYLFIQKILKSKNIVEILKEVYENIFQSRNLIISSVSNKKQKYVLPKSTKLKINKFKKLKEDPVIKRVGLGTASQVQYNALITDFSKTKIKFHGSFYILNILLRYQYLWETIREKGGAYGCFPVIKKTGLFGFVSYRDPRLKETFADYKKVIKEINRAKFLQEEIDKFIVKAISSLDTPTTETQRAGILTAQHISKISLEEIQKRRMEVLNTTSRDFEKFIELLNILRKGNMVTIGSKKMIQENKKFFNKILSI